MGWIGTQIQEADPPLFETTNPMIRILASGGGGGGGLTSEELHELLLVHAVEQALELRVSEIAEVQAGRHSTRRSRPPSNKTRS
jgi:hypothetical protein